MAGSALTSAIGYAGGRPLLMRYGKYVLISPHHLDLADRWFAERGEATAFFSRVLPVVRTFISVFGFAEGQMSVLDKTYTSSPTHTPTSAQQCKTGGGKTFGTMFKNQGQCIKHVNEHRK